MTTRTFFAWIIAIVSFSCHALEVGDLHLPLTRSDADKTLTKDYHFEILTDGTIRRTWHIAKRTVAVDFDPASDAAICITITYANPVSRKTAEADADAMSPDTEAKWKKTKPAAVEKVGIPVGSSIKEFADNSMMFLEAASAKKKYTAVSYHAKAPRKNRKELEAVAGDQRTAMGSTSMAGNIKFLIKDEENRLNTPSEAAATKTASAGTKPAANGDGDGVAAATPVAAVATPAKTAKPATTAPAKAPAPKPASSAGKEMVTIIGPNGVETVEGTVTTRTVTTGGDEEEYGNLFDVLKDKATPVQMCIAGVVLLALLFLIFASAARSRAKRRQKVKFAQVLASSPTNAAKVAAPRKKTAAK